MHLLVTGHRGYIGSVLTPRLQAVGHEVTGLDIGYFTECTMGAAVDIDGECLDVRDVTPERLTSVDAVIHLAALSNDPLGDVAPATTYEVNEHATLRLAEAAKEAGVRRFLFSSSCSLYGGESGDVLSREFSHLAPLTHYAESKRRAEEGLLRLASESFSPVLLRSATAYGYSPRLRTDLVVNDLTARAVLANEVRLESDGTAWRPFVHVEDIASAFIALLRAPRSIVHGQVFNVGRTEENYQIRAVAEIVAEVVAGSRIKIADNATSDKRDYRVSCARIAAEVPGFRPEWTVRRGVEQLAALYREHNLRESDAVGCRFRRLSMVAELRRLGRLDDRLRWAAGQQLATRVNSAPQASDDMRA